MSYGYGECDTCCFDAEDVLEGYEVSLRKMINKVIDDKIKDTVDENAELKLAISQYQEKNSFLNHEMRILKVDTEKRIKDALIEARKEITKELIPDFALGDTVWYLNSEYKSIKCKYCNGNYNNVEVEVLGKKTKVQCPHCDYGKFSYNIFKPKEDIISSVYGNFYRKTINGFKKDVAIGDLKIYLERRDNQIDPKYLYKTLEECQKACDEATLESAKKFEEKSGMKVEDLK